MAYPDGLQEFGPVRLCLCLSTTRLFGVGAFGGCVLLLELFDKGVLLVLQFGVPAGVEFRYFLLVAEVADDSGEIAAGVCYTGE